MAVIVRKPKEKELERKGWRTKTKTKVIVREREERRKRISEEKIRTQRAAHNIMLLRVRGVHGIQEERQGLLERLNNWLRSVFEKKTKEK